MQQASAMVEDVLTAPVAVAEALAPSRSNISALGSAPAHQKVVRLGTLERPLVTLLKHWSKPAVVVAALLACALYSSHGMSFADLALAMIAGLLARQIFSPLHSPAIAPSSQRQLRLTRLLIEWGAVVALLGFAGYALKVTDLFSQRVIFGWVGLTTLLLWMSEYCAARVAAQAAAATHRHIIIGANEVGFELARRISQSRDTGAFLGFFDFRGVERMPAAVQDKFAGHCQDVAEFVRRNAVNAIYIALPMSKAPRIEEMLRELRDSTASIYFVPDIFAFDLVQARCVEMKGIPMLAICDTPFYGMNAVKKRATDIVLALLALIVAWPVMLLAAIAVKLSSPGPVLFKQRRYGLHGEEIVIYKFRSMTVCEDGPLVVQAQREDKRFTAIGRFLRRTSLDELPQLFNVLEGKMSFVGPRPHAVAHNELYRKVISGYMIRHKVRPGMTGWAQIHGLRGQTTAVEDMRLRVQYDLDYLRQWSPWLDFEILLRTALIVLLGRNAH